ncbi:19176_t:CDS:1, partial [Racocetra persica]
LLWLKILMIKFNENIGNSPYPMPIDSEEVYRLKLMHHAIKSAWKSNCPSKK